MLGLDIYQYETNTDYLDYSFQSFGPNGAILKIARFTLLQPSIYNFGFADFDTSTGEFNDMAESNNGDSDKIVNTLGSIIYDFSLKYPETLIFIKGTTPARTRFYQMNIFKQLEKIKTIFEVLGYINEKWEPFAKGKNYEAFLGRRNDTFLF